jgi:ABC-type lipoprotein release transport system permease subunit
VSSPRLKKVAGGGTTPVIVDVTLAERLFANENPGILAISSFAASIIPARRAANVLPMTALRSD